MGGEPEKIQQERSISFLRSPVLVEAFRHWHLCRQPAHMRGSRSVFATVAVVLRGSFAVRGDDFRTFRHLPDSRRVLFLPRVTLKYMIDRWCKDVMGTPIVGAPTPEELLPHLTLEITSNSNVQLSLFEANVQNTRATNSPSPPRPPSTRQQPNNSVLGARDDPRGAARQTGRHVRRGRPPLHPPVRVASARRHHPRIRRKPPSTRHRLRPRLGGRIP